MNGKKPCSLIVLVILFILATGCGAKDSTPKFSTDMKQEEDHPVQNIAGTELTVQAVEPSIDNTPPAIENKSDPQAEDQPQSIVSGPAASVPWESNLDFQAAQKNNKALIRMAAYQTVLPDPLPGEEDNVHLAAGKIAGTVVKPGAVFSQNGKAGPYTAPRGYKKGPTYSGARLITTVGGGVCKVASTLYNVAVLSNLQIIERHAHGMPVPYVPYGQDATVSYGSKDIKFKNTTSAPILIWAQGVDNVLFIGFYGSEKPPQVEWHHDVKKVIKAPTVYKVNGALRSGEQRVLIHGMDGAVMKSHVTVANPDGTKTTKQMRSSYYSPFPTIIEKGK